MNPSWAIGWYNRGNIDSALGQHDKAIADFSKAIELEPDFAWAWGNRAPSRAYNGDRDGAMSDWNGTIELDPGNLPAHYNREKLRIARGDVHGAIADFRKVAELDPGLKDELRLRLLSGQLPIGDSIVVIADRASIKAEGQVIDTAMRGTALLLRGETGDQLQVRYRRAGMIDRTDAMPLEQAIAHFAEVIRRQPEDGGAYGARGNAWAFKGNFEKAVADHEQAIRLGPQDPLACTRS